MTQKQTDYDKAFCAERDAYCKEMDYDNLTEGEQDLMSDVFQLAFRKGYEYGKKQSTADHERNLIALGDDYVMARVEAIQKGYNEWLDSDSEYHTLVAYRQGWNDADTFDEAWTEQHPKDLLDRLLADHPEIIEEIKREAVQEYIKISQKAANCDIDHFRDSTKKLRAEIAMRAMQWVFADYKNISKEYSEMMSDGGMTMKFDEYLAHRTVRYADAMIKELVKDK